MQTKKDITDLIMAIIGITLLVVLCLVDGGIMP